MEIFIETTVENLFFIKYHTSNKDIIYFTDFSSTINWYELSDFEIHFTCAMKAGNLITAEIISSVSHLLGLVMLM